MGAITTDVTLVAGSGNLSMSDLIANVSGRGRLAMMLDLSCSVAREGDDDPFLGLFFEYALTHGSTNAPEICYSVTSALDGSQRGYGTVTDFGVPNWIEAPESAGDHVLVRVEGIVREFNSSSVFYDVTPLLRAEGLGSTATWTIHRWSHSQFDSL